MLSTLTSKLQLWSITDECKLVTISMLYIVDVTLTDRDRWFWFTCSAVSGQEHCLHQRDTVKNKLRRVKKYRVMTNEYEVLSFVC